jgi:putative MATE family efflux protein
VGAGAAGAAAVSGMDAKGGESMTERASKLAHMPMGRLVARISLPLMLSMLVQALYNIVDGIYLSRIGEGALAATGIAFPAQILMIAVAVGTGVGVNALLSRRLGEGREDQVRAVAVHGLILAIVSSGLFVVFGFVGVDAFIAPFTNDAQIAHMGAEYLRICLIFSQGIFIAIMAERFLQATGNTLLSMLAQLLGAVVNIVLDPILIFGWFGLPAMGVRGAAIATVVGQYSAAALALLLNYLKNPDVQISLRRFRLNFSVIRGIYRVGLPTMVVQTTSSLMLVSMNRLLAGSTAAVALFGVYYKLQSFVYMPVSGLAQGLIPIIGYNAGARQGRRVVSAYKIAILAGAAIMAVGTILFTVFPREILHLFRAEGEMLRLGVPALRIIGVTFIPMSLTVVSGFACAGLGNGMLNMLGALLRQLVLLIPTAYLLMHTLGIESIWYAFWIAELGAAAASALLVRREYLRKVRPIL